MRDERKNKVLHGKIALVTAAAGISRAPTLRLAERGATIIAADIDEAGLGALGAGSDRTETHRPDVLRAAAAVDLVPPAVEVAEALDTLLNCAGRVMTARSLTGSRMSGTALSS